MRFGLYPKWIQSAPSAGLELIVVIPCHAEPDLLTTLETLERCDPPECEVEVLIVLNESMHATPSVQALNQRTKQQLQTWLLEWEETLAFHVHAIEALDLPPRHAGVGLARKIGMDEAVRRFDAINRNNGVIANLDADCLCDPNYLQAIHRHFKRYPETPGCSIYYEHPLNHDEERINQAIAQYELHLRYYVQACRYAGFPYAYHTVGSSFAVRSDYYQSQGGMNKRMAGEDFYFIHKIIPRGGYTELNETRIIPSPRISDRVPFGTGKAMGEMLAQPHSDFFTYSFQSFLDLRDFFDSLSNLSPARNGIDLNELSLPRSIVEFLESIDFTPQMREAQANTRQDETFRKRFFQEFNAFQLMKYLHFARDHFHPCNPVVTEADHLRQRITESNSTTHADVFGLLNWFRRFERQGGLPLNNLSQREER